MAKFNKKFSSPILANILKGSLIAVSISLILILLFAVLIKLTNIPDVAISPVNQVIKIISIFLGCFLCLKKLPQKGLLTGSFVGMLYTVLAFLIFSLLGGTFSFNLTLLSYIILSTIIGGICVIMSVNKKIKQ